MSVAETTEPAAVRLKAALREKRPLVGTFIRTAAAANVEIVARAGLDFACLDAEHAVFSPRELDTCLLAARAEHFACLVRVSLLDTAAIGQMLDMGAAGVVVPHVRSAADAARLARLAHFGPGGRGFASSPRATGYGDRTMVEHLDRSRGETVIVGMLEDPEAFNEVDAMMSKDEIDGWILGYSDLTVALGASSRQDTRIEEATERAMSAAERYGRTIIAVVPGPEEGERMRAAGFSTVIVGSDQQALRTVTRTIAARLTGTA